jgi:(p)ppGpp synthase/HD superfamily hydrolase
MKDQIKLAESIARRVHANQYRRDGVTPYINHVETVVELIGKADEKTIAAAWLHDVLEEGSNISELISEGIDKEIVDIVKVLTKDKHQSYSDYINTVSQNAIASKIKLADIAHNFYDDPTAHQIEKYAKALELLLI